MLVISKLHEVDWNAEILEIERVVEPARRQDHDLVRRSEERSKDDVERSRCSRGENDVAIRERQTVLLGQPGGNQSACDCATAVLGVLKTKLPLGVDRRP